MNSITELKTLESYSWPNEPSWLKEVRTQARAVYQKLDWPGRKDEEWKRSSLSDFLLETRNLPAAPASTKPASKSSSDFSGVLTFQNGALVQAWVDESLKAKGIVFGSLQDLAQDSKLAASIGAEFSKALARADVKVVPLHYAYLEYGAVLIVPPSLILEKPLLIEVREERKGVLTSPHLFVSVGRLSQSTLVVRSTSPNGADFTVNSATTLRADEGATFQMIDVQNQNHSARLLDHSFGTIERDAQILHWNACLGAAFVKSKFHFDLAGEGCSLRAHGMYFGVEDQKKDLRIVQNHCAAHASSYALYKGAVRDRSRTVFQGLIEVQPNANGTDAYLSNKNLILNDGARADSLPQLKIDTNDVKCSHGSTTGKVNEDEVFYLTTRGLNREEARLLIAQGMFAELIAEAPEFLREELENEVYEALGGDKGLS